MRKLGTNRPLARFYHRNAAEMHFSHVAINEMENNMRKFLATTALAMVLATGANAAAHTGAFVTQAESGQMRGSEFIGMRVYAAEVEDNEVDSLRVNETRLMVGDNEREWDDIGEINDVLLSRDGKVTAVLIDVGGFLGLGEKTVAVSMDQIKFVSENDEGEGEYFLVVNSSEETLKDAPEFQTAVMDGDIMDNETAEGDMTGQMAETDNMAATGTNGAVDNNMAAPKSTDMTMNRDPNSPFNDFRVDGYAEVDYNQMTAEDLDGARVYGIGDEDVGEISELLLTEDGKIDKAIIDVGGFLGIGEKSVAVGFDKLSIQKENNGANVRVYIDASEDSLKQLPEYDS